MDMTKIGILPDGSLSSRLKGDIYWKKQKLMLRSAQELSAHNIATEHFLSKFEVSDKSGGSSFTTLEDVREGGTGSTMPKPEYNKFIKEHRLNPMAISEYEELIPQNYVSQIKNASLTVKTYHDNDRFLGLSITGVHSGWMELVWISPAPGVTPDEIRGLLALIIDRAQEEKKYKGFFAELHMVEVTGQMEELLRACGLQTVHVKNNLYEFTYRDVVLFDKLELATQRHPCTPVGQAPEDVKTAIEDVLYEEKTPVPVAFPVPWSKCRQDLSLVHYDQKITDTGLLLVSEMSDTLIIDLLYGKNPVVAAALLGNAIVVAKDILSPDQKILVPIVMEATRPLVERIAPTATREDLVEAFMKF
ncbi:MAG: hypothetical protein K6B14_09780 [Lachnospiraceae bacterium]|nr:hypothetical protein [Lachnospiraceae bacterium]